MNAYELADQVEMWGKDLLALNMKGGIPVTEGAKLIRQQADRIAELEKGIRKILEGCRNVKEDNPDDKNLKDLSTLIIRDCNLFLGKNK